MFYILFFMLLALGHLLRHQGWGFMGSLNSDTDATLRAVKTRRVLVSLSQMKLSLCLSCRLALSLLLLIFDPFVNSTYFHMHL